MLETFRYDMYTLFQNCELVVCAHLQAQRARTFMDARKSHDSLGRRKLNNNCSAFKDRVESVDRNLLADDQVAERLPVTQNTFRRCQSTFPRRNRILLHDTHKYEINIFHENRFL